MMKIVVDKFNTEHFGITMGNLSLDRVYNVEDFKDAFSKIEDIKNFKHITLRIPTSDKETTNSAIKNGFSICDTLVEWIFTNGKSILPELEYKVVVRECQSNDLSQLKTIAKNSFKIDRFHSDKSLDNGLCDEYYEKWIENSYQGLAEKVFVAEYGGKPIGFMTAKTYKDDANGHMVLSAVSSEYRGLGVYTCLVHYCAKWMFFAHPEIKGIIVGTQIDNIAVQKAWARLGFSPYSSSYVLQMNKK